MWSGRSEVFQGAPWTTEAKRKRQELEERSQKILPLIEQTAYYRNGMRQKFTPEQLKLAPLLVDQLAKAGKTVQALLTATAKLKSIPDSLVPDQFRIDFILDENQRPKIAEIQPDDRGLPAAAIFRNAYGSDKSLVGVVPAYMEKNCSEPNSLTVIVVPRSQQFYYQGFEDFCQIGRALTENEIWLAYSDQIEAGAQKVSLRASPNKPITALQFFLGPNPEENSGLSTLADIASTVGTQIINPPNPFFESKLPLALVWNAELAKWQPQLAEETRRLIPPTYLVNSDTDFSEQLKAEKDSWVLKPVFGAWSQGVNIGWCLDRKEWRLAVQKATQSPNTQVAQQFVWTPDQSFPVRKKPGVFVSQDFYLRVEGYYFTINGITELADVLVTGRPELPVHGRRDCIMTPAFTYKS